MYWQPFHNFARPFASYGDRRKVYCTVTAHRARHCNQIRKSKGLKVYRDVSRGASRDSSNGVNTRLINKISSFRATFRYERAYCARPYATRCISMTLLLRCCYRVPHYLDKCHRVVRHVLVKFRARRIIFSLSLSLSLKEI